MYILTRSYPPFFLFFFLELLPKHAMLWMTIGTLDYLTGCYQHRNLFRYSSERLNRLE